jgi:alkanesulfonate monooxygenase SsuD/methylene tetrahydromethanopterin reductase-like flavin-dependent oxidoreductase (luciferase family)
LEIIGHYGDGWDSFLNTPETFRNRVETIRAAARHVGRNPDDIDPVATILTIMTEDQKDLERAINQTKRILLVEGSMLRILGLKLPEGFQTYQNLLMDDKDLHALGQAVGTVSDELALRFVAHGTNEILEKIEEFRSVGAKHVTIRFIDETEQSLRRFSEKVLRNFDV